MSDNAAAKRRAAELLDDGAVFAFGLSEKEQRTVMYVVAFPNLLISLHPDYVMTHTLRPIDQAR